jgi:hypothetical protein
MYGMSKHIAHSLVKTILYGKKSNDERCLLSLTRRLFKDDF